MKRTRKLFVLAATLTLSMFFSQVPAFAQEDQGALLGRLTTEIAASALLSDSSKELTKTKLLPILVNPVLVAEIKTQNAKKVSLDVIKKIDEEWKAKDGDVPLLEELKVNATAKELNSLIKGIPQLVECFVMDNQGANVGQYNDTSDYWQGDEPKWQKSFNAGKGGVEVGKKEIDQSTALAQQQISLPMIDADGTVVGAVTFGISVAD